MQQPPEVNPDPVQGLVAELSKRLDSLETSQREHIQALRQDIARIESHQREDAQALRQDIARNMRWVIGIQLTTLLALGTLILTRLPG